MERMGRMKKRSFVSMALCLTLLFSVLSNVWTGAAFAKESRAAIVVSVEGTVMVTKAGGSTEYRAFEDMSLSQGDHIRTEAGSNVVLQVVDQEDEVTIGENTELYISSLVEADDGGKKSKLKMWAGSLWFKVKKLVNADDEFEVETPTAVMGVRGSNGYIETKLGQIYALMTSGVLETTPTTDNGGHSDSANVYPGQQINLLDESGEFSEYVTPIDIKGFVGSAPPSVIQQLLTTIQIIREENEQFVQDVGDGAKKVDPKSGLKLDSSDELQKFGANLTNLIANIAKEALDAKKLPANDVQQLIEKANQATQGDKIDLNNVKPYDPSVGLDPAVQQAKREQMERLKNERERQQENEKRQQQERLRQNAALQQQLEAERKRLEEANKKAKEEQEKKANEQYIQQLTAAERLRFEQDQRNAEEQKKRQEAKQQQNQGNTPTNNNTPTGGGTGGDDGGTGGDGGSGGDTTPPTGTLRINHPTDSQTETTHDYVTLYVTGSSDTSKVTIADNQSFTGAITRDFVKTSGYDFMMITYPLTKGYGDYTIFVKLRDAAGNESPIYSSSIKYKEGTVGLPQRTVKLTTNKTADELLHLNHGESLDLNVELDKFAENDRFYAAEVHIAINEGLFANPGDYTDHGPGYLFDGNVSESVLGQQFDPVAHEAVLKYVITNFKESGTAVGPDNVPAISTPSKLVTLHLDVHNTMEGVTEGAITIKNVILVNKNGDRIVNLNTSTTPLLYKVYPGEPR